MLIAIRFARIFRRDDMANFFFDTLARDVLAVASSQAALKEELELKKSLGGMNVLVRCSSAYGGLMHIDIFGDIAQDHGPQMADAVIKKLLLKLEDALRDSKQRLLSLLNALDQPVSGADFLLQILPRLFLGCSFLTGKTAIERIYP